MKSYQEQLKSHQWSGSEKNDKIDTLSAAACVRYTAEDRISVLNDTVKQRDKTHVVEIKLAAEKEILFAMAERDDEICGYKSRIMELEDEVTEEQDDQAQIEEEVEVFANKIQGLEQMDEIKAIKSEKAKTEEALLQLQADLATVRGEGRRAVLSIRAPP